jgi:hypothetical protein
MDDVRRLNVSARAERRLDAGPEPALANDRGKPP